MYSRETSLHSRILAIFILIYMFLPIIISLTYKIGVPDPTNNQIDVMITAMSIESYEVQILPPDVEWETVVITSDNIAPQIVIPIPTKPPEPEFSEEDIALIERVTMSESSTQSFDVQVAVAQTVINRLHNGNFGDSIREVVYSENQFSTADNGDPNEQVTQAVMEAIKNHPYPSDMLYFRQWYYHTWAEDYVKLGDLYFSLEPSA